MGSDTVFSIQEICYDLVKVMEEKGHIRKVSNYTYVPTDAGRAFFNSIYPGSHQATLAEDISGAFVGEAHKTDQE